MKVALIGAADSGNADLRAQVSQRRQRATAMRGSSPLPADVVGHPRQTHGPFTCVSQA